nr:MULTISPECIES: TetR/AcrR family transcriptional regulator [unclassified Actinomyces]
MDARDRADQIVAHATELIADKGYFGFSVGELAQRCGLSNAGLIHHIGSKERALQMVLETRDRRDMAALGCAAPEGSGPGQPLGLLTAATGAAPPADAGAAVLHRLVAHNATQPTIIRLYAILRAEALSEDHPSYDYFRQRDAQAVAAFEQLLTGAVRDPRTTARATLALMGGIEEQWLREPEQVDLVATWDAAYAALIAGSR